VKQKTPMCDMPIATRLDNWGLCQRGKGGGVMAARETRRASPYGGQGYQCMTLVACNALRNRALGPAPGKTAQSKLDFKDAERIQDAWRRLSIKHQLLLKDLYVLDKSVNTICRQLNIKHTPGFHWNRELAAAQDAIEDIVDSGNR
jgi:hypothetical protein